jgi:arylsulfatase A-like enzyme
VFILADDMGWTGLSSSMDERIPDSCSDFYQTPRIEELARQGMRFSNAYSPSSLCTPSRGSILTGKSPALTRITTPGRASGQANENHKLIPPRHVDALPESETTVAEVLQGHGYATAHFGKWHLNGGGPGYHGFEWHDGETGNGGAGEYGDPNPKDIFGITNRGIAFMQQQVAGGKPFYLQLSHYAVHSPPKALTTTTEACVKKPAGTRHHSVAHAAMTRDLDTGVGMILDSIERLGIADNTYVIFMSDNGAPAGPRKRAENMPLFGGKATFWEGGIRVPLIIRGPDVAANVTCHQRVVGFDLFPTLCELGGVAEMPEGVEGGSLAALLAGDANGNVERPRPEVVFHFPHYAQGPDQIPQSALYLGDYKLLRIYETDTNHLFKLSDDIGEQHDLAESMPEKASEMEQALNAYLSQVKAQLPVENPNYVPEASAPRARGSARRAAASEDRPMRRRQEGTGRPVGGPRSSGR